MEWQLQTRAGVFWMRANRDGRVTLGIGDEALGNFATPNLAAGDVHSHMTGHGPWDRLTTYNTPDDISGWTRIR